MKHYIIDGNNLIGKIRVLKSLHKKSKIKSAEKLAFIVGRFFTGKNAAVNLYFDGFQSEVIKVSGIKIIHSGNKTADEKIKSEIEKSSNPRNIILVTSDNNLAEFGRVCSCMVVPSESFSKTLLSSDKIDDEQIKIEEINNQANFKKIFGVED